MTNPIQNNAYRLLGLDITASQKEILKRYKEIINRLKIDDYPEYDIDYCLPKKFRNENSVNDAFKQLQSQKNNVKEYFFWFQINDKLDETAWKYVTEQKIFTAIKTWKSGFKNTNSTSYFYKKNVAILCCILLHDDDNENNANYLSDSISLWRDIVNDDKFWAAFFKRYCALNEKSVSQDTISDFKKNIIKELSDIYADIGNRHKSKKYIKEFQEAFGVHGEKTEKNLLQPIFKLIYENVEELDKIKITEEGKRNTKIKAHDRCDNCGTQEGDIRDFKDGSTLCNSCYRKIGEKWEEEVDELSEDNLVVRGNVKKIFGYVHSIEKTTEELKEMGLFNDAQSKVVRDHAAEAIRAESIKIYNVADMVDDSIKLLKIAISMCGTDSLKTKMEEDLEIIKKNSKNQSLAVEIPGSGGTAKFRNNSVEYDGKKIFYRDVIGVSYSSNSSSLNGIPTTQSHNFEIRSDKEEVSLSTSSLFRIGSKEKEEAWYKLINLSKHFIEPFIIKRLVERIFEEGKTVDIGEVEFSKKGYCRSKFFGGLDWVYWDDAHIYIPRLYQGKVILFKDHNGEGKEFTSISMEEENAVVLPEFLQACTDYYHYKKRQKNDE